MKTKLILSIIMVASTACLSQTTTVSFREKFKRAFEASEFKSYRQLSLAAECSEPVVQQIMSGKFDGSKSGPGVFTFYRLTRALGASIDGFLETSFRPKETDLSLFNAPRERDPAGFDALMAIHWRGGGRLEAFDDVKEHMDLFEEPSEGSYSPQIRRIGAKTLLCMRLQTTDIRIAQKEIDALPLTKRRELLDYHAEIVTRGLIADNTFLDHRLVSKPVHVRASYSRLGMRVEDVTGELFAALACKPIPV